ncbi:pyrimidine reductase family protein [Okibacterium endophyticum]
MPGEVRIDLSWPASSGPLTDDEILDLYKTPDRASEHLRVNFVSSADGAATHNGLSGDLGSSADKRVFDLLRRLGDVVLVGAGTVRAEGYGAMVLDERSVAWRQKRGLAPQPVFAIVTASGDLDPRSSVFTEAPVRPVVVTTARVERLGDFDGVADVLACGAETVDLDAMVAAFRERGLNQVHCEGGPTLFGSLLAADRVDELCLTLSPRLEGGGARRIVTGELSQPRALELAHTLVAQDGTLLLRYTRR